MKIRFNLLVAVCISISICGCAGKYKNNVDFNASEPIRVAVLPFVQVDGKDQTIEPDSSLLIDDVSLLSSKQKGTPAMFVRNLVQNELTKSGLDIVSPAVVDSNLSHKGFDNLKKNPPFELDKVRRASPQDICSNVVSCDAVLYGKITRWSRNYYGIQSVNTVGIDLKLLSAKDGKVLFSSSAEDSDSRGITKGPTGFSDLVIEPIKGLDSAIITELARRVTAKMISPLQVQNRPEFLASAPPAIFASAHDVADGRLSQDGALTVVALGNSKNFASFSIGNVIENLPMVEKDNGHYIGKYFPLPNDAFNELPVTVSLRDQFGRTTAQKIGTANVSLR